jgi:protease-4
VAESGATGEPRRGRATGTLAVLLAVLLGLSLLFNLFLLFALFSGLALAGGARVGDRVVERVLPYGGEGPEKVVVVPVRGLLIEEDLPGIAAGNPVGRVRSMLARAAEDPAVRGIVLAIDSPGGAVTASDLLHHAVAEFRRTQRIPVAASFGDVAASGAYYLAVAAERIFSHATTVTGSIGVLFARLDLTGLLEKIGVEDDTVVSGATPLKTLGSPTRRMSEAAREVVRGVVDEMYERFVRIVDEGRDSLDEAAVRRLADGRIYTGLQAREAGLVDEIGYVEDAVEWVRRRAEVPQARAVTYDRLPSFLESLLLGEAAARPAPAADLLGRDRRPRFLYLWTGEP